jgi:DNA-binding transcriptional ArsR family regulator
METNLAPVLDLAFVDSDSAVAAVAHPERRGLLQALAEHPDSASGLAERIGGKRQRINYHVRSLLDAGLIELAEERPRRGLTEMVYRPVAQRFVIDPSILGDLDAGEELVEGDRWAASYAIALASRTTRELAALLSKAGRQGKRLATASMDTTVRLRTPNAMEEFVDDLARAIGEVVSRHDDIATDARPFRVTSCSHAAPAETIGSDNTKE